MRHPQEDLLIVLALTTLARDYEGLPLEERALSLATEIADEHGLEPSEAILQLED